jgi:hypothetical protein
MCTLDFEKYDRWTFVPEETLGGAIKDLKTTTTTGSALSLSRLRSSCSKMC